MTSSAITAKAGTSHGLAGSCVNPQERKRNVLSRLVCRKVQSGTENESEASVIETPSE